MLVKKEALNRDNIIDYPVEIILAYVLFLCGVHRTVTIEGVEFYKYLSPSFKNFEAIGKPSFNKSFVRGVDCFAERMKIVAHLFLRRFVLFLLVVVFFGG